MKKLLVFLSTIFRFSLMGRCGKTRILNRSPLVLTVLFLTCAVLFPFQASGFSPGSYRVTTFAQKYFNFLGSYSYPTKATGSFTGEIFNSNVASSDGNQFKFGYEKEVHFCIPKPWPLDGCIYEYTHVYGIGIDWNFDAKGAVRYNYIFPYTADFRFPITVYPGQRIELPPTFAWSGPSLGATQNYEFSHTTSFWVDAPLDGLDDLTTKFTQYATKAHLDLNLPVVPFAPAISVSGDCTVWQCASGGGEWGGSYTKLGGTGTLNNSGRITYNISPTDVSVGAAGNSGPAWKQGHEQFELITTVLTYIPVTAPAGVALDFVRRMGEFKLNTQLDASIYRTDYVNLQLSEAPYVLVPPDLKTSPWVFKDLPVTVKYRVQGCSGFSYPMGYNVIFDMLGIDPQTLLHEDLISIDAGGGCTNWIEREGKFFISGSVPMVQKDRYTYKELLLESTDLAAFKIPIYNVSTKPSQFKPGLKAAILQDTQKAIRLRETVSIPKPTAEVGVPLTGQYTAILGTTSQVTAEQIINAIKSKGISAFTVAVPGSQDKLITLGSFANRKDAETLSNFLKEIFRIENSVSQIIDSKSYVPIKSDVLTKIQSK